MKTFHDHLIDLWSHRLTAFMGLSLGTASSFLDLLNKVLACVALSIGIYFSWKKGTRETSSR